MLDVPLDPLLAQPVPSCLSNLCRNLIINLGLLLNLSHEDFEDSGSGPVDEQGADPPVLVENTEERTKIGRIVDNEQVPDRTGKKERLSDG